MSISNFQIFPLFPTAWSGAQQWNLPNHSADPHFLQSPVLSHCLPIISLAWISFPCIPCSLLASFGLSPILHPPHHPGLLKFFFKLVWRASISPSHLQLPQSPLLHAFRSGFQLEWYSYRLSLSQDKSRCLWAKSESDMHQLGSPDFRERLQAPSSWAAHRQLRPRGWLHHITPVPITPVMAMASSTQRPKTGAGLLCFYSCRSFTALSDT